jgi:hypothetical protein
MRVSAIFCVRSVIKLLFYVIFAVLTTGEILLNNVFHQ